MAEIPNNTFEILKKCFDPQNGTFNVSPDNEQEIFRAVYDTENEALRVTISGVIIQQN